MKRIAIEPTTAIDPHPVLLVGTFGVDGKPNIMNAAWGGICCSDPPCVAVSLREATLTYHHLLYSKAFTVGFPPRRHLETADYDFDCDGLSDIVSGSDGSVGTAEIILRTHRPNGWRVAARVIQGAAQ